LQQVEGEAGVGVHADDELAREALAVLHANSIGRATKPSRRLYPHQWSWDSACVAIGYAGVDQARAESELRALFDGQWSNGMLPHIVFTDGARYFPGPEFWQTSRAPEAPTTPQTSGIVQPAVHGTAAWEVYRRGRDRDRAEAFARELLPKLEAWHAYLYRERTRDGGAVVETWHPWETGMDNSPLWDEPLGRIELRPDDIPEYQRVDVQVTNAAERPSDRDYDRYAYLVALFRELSYDPARVRAATPFAVQPVLFNSLLVQSNRDLASLARAIGADATQFEEWADRTALELEALWDDDVGVYRDFDVLAGMPVPTWCSAGLAPLYAGVPAAERAARMAQALARSALPIDDGWAATSLPPDDPRFDPTLYWRGPVWPILNWVLQRGLSRYGFDEPAERIRTTLIELARERGFWEHYDPLTGEGHGGESFSWTAAFVLDLLGSTSTNGHPHAPN
jgi:hypothetical protein